MDKLFKSVGIKVPWLSTLTDFHDDDPVDRLSHRTTTIMLIILAIVVTTKQFVGSNIDCWVPAHFTNEQLEYVNDYCWVSNTYRLEHHVSVPSHEERDKLPYYQWVAIILLVQALMFYLPYLLWNSITAHSGVNVKTLVQAGHVFVTTEMSEVRAKTLLNMTQIMDRYLKNVGSNEALAWTLSVKHIVTRIGCCLRCCCSNNGKTNRQSSNYLARLYLAVKILYAVNAVGQLFLLDHLLGINYHFYGIDALGAAINGVDFTAIDDRFPRTTMCDVKVRRLGQVHRYSVQCVLPVNLFNEKIFLFLWFWTVMIVFVTIFSLVAWFVRMAETQRRRYIKQHLKFANQLESDQDRKQARTFCNAYLQTDGAFVLRLVATNTDTITVTELIAELWKNYKAKGYAVDTSPGQTDGGGGEGGEGDVEAGSALDCGVCCGNRHGR